MIPLIMKIALCQLDMAWEDKSATKRRILSLMSDCSPKDRIDWVVFPEMTLTGFSMNAAKTTLDAADLSFFAELARAHHACVSFGGVQGGCNDLITMDASGQVIGASFENPCPIAPLVLKSIRAWHFASWSEPGITLLRVVLTHAAD